MALSRQNDDELAAIAEENKNSGRNQTHVSCQIGKNVHSNSEAPLINYSDGVVNQMKNVKRYSFSGTQKSQNHSITRLNKQGRLFIAIAVLVVILFIALIPILLLLTISKPSPSDLVNFIRNGLNSSISPCHDFYGHICSSHNSSSKKLQESQFYLLIMPAIINDTDHPEVAKTLLHFIEECVKVSLSSIDTIDSLRQMCFYEILSQERFAIFNLYAENLVRRAEFPMTQIRDQLRVKIMSNKIKQKIEAKLSVTVWMQNNTESAKIISRLMGTKVVIGLEESVGKYGDASEIDYFEISLLLHEEEDIELLVYRAFSRLEILSEFESQFMSTATAITYPNHTVIELSHMYLQRPFYATEFPQSYNYGFMGKTIGHELFHQLTPQRIEMSWKSNARYSENVDCYTDFYDGICFNLTLSNSITNVAGLHKVCAKGVTDRDENIPDVEGTRVAFEAMKEVLGEEKLKERAMPEFDYTNEQLFFVAVAQDYCDKDLNDHEYLANDMRDDDPHASGNVRVNAIAMQMKEFAEAFQCKPDDPMVMAEKEKCYLLPGQ